MGLKITSDKEQRTQESRHTSAFSRGAQLKDTESSINDSLSLFDRRKLASDLPSKGRRLPAELSIKSFSRSNSLVLTPLSGTKICTARLDPTSNAIISTTSAVITTPIDGCFSSASCAYQSHARVPNACPRRFSSVYSGRAASSGFFSPSWSYSLRSLFPGSPRLQPLKLHKVKIVNHDNLQSRIQSFSASNFYPSSQALLEGLSPENGLDFIPKNSFELALPTPRRSRGWWNIITSPFSALSGHFPDLREVNSPEAEPILPDVREIRSSSVFKHCSSDSKRNAICRAASVIGENNVHRDTQSKIDGENFFENYSESECEVQKDFQPSSQSLIATDFLHDMPQQNFISSESRERAEIERPTSYVTPDYRKSLISHQLDTETSPSLHHLSEGVENFLNVHTFSLVDAVPLTNFETSPRIDEGKEQSTYALPYGNQTVIKRSFPKTRTFVPFESKGHSSRHLQSLFSTQEDTGRLETRPKHSFLLIMGIFLLIIVSLSLVLPLTITQTFKDMPVQPGWLNNTNYPPLPTGIMAVSSLRLISETTGCIGPSSFWNCSTFIGPQIGRLDSNQVSDWIMEIRFDPSNPYNNRSGSKLRMPEKTNYRDETSSPLYESNPLPPSTPDEEFLGNTTDGQSPPFSGLGTPFFISVIPTKSQSTVSLKRRPFIDKYKTTLTLPPPIMNSDGSVLVQELYPSPVAQPLKLYDQGQPSEHYGFYTYYDRSIFLNLEAKFDDSMSMTRAASSPSLSYRPQNAQCTFSQTRLLVQIWTRAGSVFQKGKLVNSDTSRLAARVNSEMEPPISTNSPPLSSFPFPITVTVDRHGGDSSKKGVYCYGIDGSGQVLYAEGVEIPEDRSFNGTIINPAARPFSTIAPNPNAGGVDGGTGGCKCVWNN